VKVVLDMVVLARCCCALSQSNTGLLVSAICSTRPVADLFEHPSTDGSHWPCALSKPVSPARRVRRAVTRRVASCHRNGNHGSSSPPSHDASHDVATSVGTLRFSSRRPKASH
jgi:hypothetical protein